jgi:F420-non-reducing hydrogenase large subunit
MTSKITISPITRLEGHGKIDIILDDAGDVADCFFQVVELRGFEKFLEGRPAEELARITPKICGVCPGAHHMASAKALDALYSVEPPPAARKLRELFLAAHIAHSHTLHFFALGAPDFIPGPEAPAAERNLLGLIAAVGPELGRRVIAARGLCQKIQGIIAGHPIHPVAALPGGMSKALDEQERERVAVWAEELVAVAQLSLELFRERVLGEPALAAQIDGDLYYHETHYAGLVDPAGKVNFYDGRVRVIDPAGEQVALFDGADYLEQIAERVLPWSYLKVPYLRAKGYQGLRAGADSGIYRVNALARLNVASGMATPLADAARDELFAHFGGPPGAPVHHTLAFHWARLVELLYVCERVRELIADPEITSAEVRVVPTVRPDEGVGVVEAARGTLYHHYVSDARGMIKKVNLIVATAQNNAAMNLSVKRAATRLIRGGEVSPALLDQVEMAFRAYDPCLACATHALPGKMALVVTVRRPDGEVVAALRRDPS